MLPELLGTNLHINVLWVPSEANPSDAPSRGAPLWHLRREAKALAARQRWLRAALAAAAAAAAATAAQQGSEQVQDAADGESEISLSEPSSVVDDDVDNDVGTQDA